MKNFLSILLFFFTAVASAQKIKSDNIDLTAAEEYIKIARQIENGASGTPIQWTVLSNSLPYQLMIQGGVIDSARYKSDMLKVYSSNTQQDSLQLNQLLSYHYKYKRNLTALASYLMTLKNTNSVDSIKRILYPFLPSRLQEPDYFPTLFYFHYGMPYATGMGGMVLNDLLFSYQLDSYKFGLLASHEALHAILSVAFEKKFENILKTNSTESNLLYFLENVSEEGVSDLIDKP